MASLDSQQEGHSSTIPEYQQRINAIVDTMSKEMNSTCSNVGVIPNDIDNSNRNLTFLLLKELKNSDVSYLKRMVLPKKVAEAHLPVLKEKEGMIINMENFVEKGNNDNTINDDATSNINAIENIKNKTNEESFMIKCRPIIQIF